MRIILLMSIGLGLHGLSGISMGEGDKIVKAPKPKVTYPQTRIEPDSGKTMKVEKEIKKRFSEKI